MDHHDYIVLCDMNILPVKGYLSRKRKGKGKKRKERKRRKERKKEKKKEKKKVRSDQFKGIAASL